MNLKKNILVFMINIVVLSNTLIASPIEGGSRLVGGTISANFPKELKISPISLNKENDTNNMTTLEHDGIRLGEIQMEEHKIDMPSTVTPSSAYNIVNDTSATELVDNPEMQLLALPDLSIIEFTHNTGNYPFAAGGNAPLRYVLSNTGGVAASNVHVGIYIDGDFIGTQNLGNLSANYNYAVSFEIGGVPAGNHTIMLKADYYNYVQESNENNNTRSATFNWEGIPDLVVEILSDGDVSEIPTGESLGYQLIVYNIGSEVAYGPFEVDLVLDNGEETSTTTFEVSNLPSGYGASASFNATFHSGLIGTVMGVADTGNSVRESNENNNSGRHECNLFHVHNLGSYTSNWVHSTEASLGNGTPYLTRPSITVSRDASRLYTSNQLNSIKRWNNISSNVVIDNYVVSDDETSDVIITVAELPLNHMGDTTPIDSFTKTKITLTNDTILLTSTDAVLSKAIAHEMGHALGLAHPYEQANHDNCPYPSIMFQGGIGNATLEVTSADKGNIRHLFGK